MRKAQAKDVLDVQFVFKSPQLSMDIMFLDLDLEGC